MLATEPALAASITAPDFTVPAGGAALREPIPLDLRRTALAFSGYAPTNLGRGRETLAHPVYGPMLREMLAAASEICSDSIHRPVDLVARVEQGREPDLADYGEAIALIVATQLAQLQIVHEVYGVDCRHSRFSFGYSLGEVTALIFSGVFKAEEVLPPLLSLADECVEMAHDVSVGLLIFQGPVRRADTESLCLAISSERRGAVAVSAHVSANAVMLVGQANTLDVFAERMPSLLGPRARLRRLKHRWPPLHTPLMRDRQISAKVAEKLALAAGGARRPNPPILSLVTAKFSYGEQNSRETLTAWIDRPQLLSDAVSEVLASGIDTIVHVGPSPDLIPTTFARLSATVGKQLGERSLNAVGMRVASGVVRHHWLARFLSSRTAYLRAPHVNHIMLEDWLLRDQTAQSRCTADVSKERGSGGF